MDASSPLIDALDAVDRLPPDDQAALVAIVQRRLAEQGRQRVIAETRESQQEFESGRCRLVSVADLMGEILL